MIKTNFTPKVHQAQPGVFEQVLSNDPSRNVFAVQNNGTDDIYVGFGSGASELNSLKIAAGGFYEPYCCPTNAIYISAASGAAGNVPVMILTDEHTTRVNN